MKKCLTSYHLVGWLMISLFVNTAYSEKKLPNDYTSSKVLKHRVEHVTVFSDQAEIKRLAEVNLQPGTNWYRIANLNSNMNKETIRVLLGKGNKARIAQILVESTFEHKSLPAELASKVEELDKSYAQLLDIQQTEYRMKNQLSFLREINFDEPVNTSNKFKEFKVFDAKIGTVKTAINSVSNLVEKEESSLQKIKASIQKVRQRITHLQREIRPVTELNDQVWLNHVHVLIDSKASVKTNLSVIYKIPNAQWLPRYDLRVSLKRNQGQADIKLVTAGLIEQHTGENWEDVGLTLSSLDPVQLYLPPLDKWVFSEHREELKPRKKFKVSAKKRAYKKGNSVKSVTVDPNKTGLLSAFGSKGMQKELSKAYDGRGKLVGMADNASGRAGRPRDNDSLGGSLRAGSGRGKSTSGSSGMTMEEESMADYDSSEDYDEFGEEDILPYSAPVRKSNTSHNYVLFPLQPLESIYTELAQAKNIIERSKSQETERNVYESVRGPAQYNGKKSYLDNNLPAVQAGGRLIEYKSPFKINLKNDEPRLQIPLMSQKLSAKLTYLAIPKMDNKVYLKARTENTTTIPILAGDAQIFMNGDLVSKTELKTVSEGGYFDVNLGVDPNVKTKRDVARVSQEKGFLSKDHSTRVNVTLEVKNNHSFPLQLILKDNFPLTDNSKIKVELIETEPKFTSSKSGIITWDTRVPASSLKKFTFSYKVSHPQNYIVSEFN